MSALINVEAEAALLGAILQENGLIDKVADGLAYSDFSEPVHARIFSAVVEQYSKGKSVTPITIKGYLEGDKDLTRLGGFAYLARLTSDMHGLLAPMDLCTQIAEISKRRRMADGLRMAALDCEDLSITTAEIVSEADAAISDSGGDLVNQLSAAQCFDEMVRENANRHVGVKCGEIAVLDGLLGPMRPKQLIIGAGRPGMGKTALALSYAIGAARNGHGVLYVSLEMSGAELAARMAADMCFNGNDGVPYHAIRDWELTHSQKQAVADARREVDAMPFEVIDVGSLTVGRLNMLIRRHARRMEARGHKLELVIVDYLQLLSPDSRGRSNYEAVSEVSRALKAMAKDNGVAIFALAQLSREVEKRPGCRPQLSDLRDSGQIEQDADAVLFLLRPHYYLKNDEPDDPSSEKYTQWLNAMEQTRDVLEFILAKRRNGETGNAVGMFNGFYQAVRG
jgi:replicative DNA helicase